MRPDWSDISPANAEDENSRGGDGGGKTTRDSQKPPTTMATDQTADDDDDCFFDSLGRVSSSLSFDARGLGGSSSSDTDLDDPRASFFSAVGHPSDLLRRRYSFLSSPSSIHVPEDEDYGIWTEQPLSIHERRRRLLQGMGLINLGDSIREVVKEEALPSSDSLNSLPSPRKISKSKSEQLLGVQFGSGTLLVRSLSAPPSSFGGEIPKNGDEDILGAQDKGKICTIKDLDSGREFVIDESLEDGSWNRLCDPQTGLRLTLEEFEKSLGYSPIVRELMRRANIVTNMGDPKIPIRSSKPSGRKKGIGWLKNIREVAISVTALVLEKDREVCSTSPKLPLASAFENSSSSEWTKVRQSRKPFKELTGLYLCQEIKAHQGSIWTIKFNMDGEFLASAGEDRIIHVWQVIERDDHATSSLTISGDDLTNRLGTSPDQSISLEVRESRRFTTKILSHRKRRSVPGYVIPGTVFSLSEKPVCSFRGHLEDVLDLSWSLSQVRS